MSRARWFLLILPFCTACYTYSSTELANVPEGAMVRARITSDQSVRVQPLIGRELRVLDGVLVGTSPDTVVLEVPGVASAVTGGSLQVLRQRLSIPRGGITEVDLKKLNRGRTLALIAAGTVGIGYVLLDALNIGPGKETNPTQPSGPDFHIPLLRLHH